MRRNQEDLVAAAWDQAAELRRANEVLRQGQLARTVADSLHRRLPGAASGTADERLDARMLQMTSAVRDAVDYGDGTAADELGRNEEAGAPACSCRRSWSAAWNPTWWRRCSSPATRAPTRPGRWSAAYRRRKAVPSTAAARLRHHARPRRRRAERPRTG
ncbi:MULTISPECIES: hypothetical protein [Streptomyces]|uniref:Uncharacterized protein n=1 Tax=Streptomyces nymphaeiformis TaxID=2663842 RepID=A0A7W7UA78_9ACTN|nr:hypothetical protein [Streptomyces nymphaeiformis]MBB4986535.1 hypothetical protein [Streptomyces nymphaeiformis]